MAPRTRTETDIIANVDPEIAPAIAATLTPWLPDGELEVSALRELDAGLAAARERPVVSPAPDVVHVSGPDGDALELRIHAARGGAPAPALLWIHGGGMILGAAEGDDALCRAYADGSAVAVVAVDYRLAPEHPHPAPVEDCYRALEWIASAQHPAIAAGRIAVAGASAGGGLALGLALLARDRGGPRIDYVQAIYPMIDDRGITAAHEQLALAPVWNARLDELAWAAYLGGAPADHYAAPARAEDVAGLPSLAIDTAEFDLFRDDDIDFARRVLAAGGRCELHVEAGTVHGFDGIAPLAAVSRRAWGRRFETLARALGVAVPVSE
ncbi:alpha/beta hydrolase [Salinibacterium soli]|uniref:Alpha/beta hydrolase n=1 Tax=Antiquaquibacter soli TaxID=3064523 RepID=A0ABT9BML5_9MICO|nr:alpha/beta hydrolase [Protaetiibacter sp. WY-16]MDO7881662.1 alpha/beta hydrolase [Protaetiibacter sp. WY-16]